MSVLFDARKTLASYYHLNKIPPALLFRGLANVDKGAMAHKFAQFLLCEQPLVPIEPCLKCAACDLFRAETHPDFYSLESLPNTIIKIEQIRHLIEWVSTKPQRGRYRIAVIGPMEALNSQAANAFLKTLEEPGPQVVFLLLTEKFRELPPTLLSRCQSVLFNTPYLEWYESHIFDHKPHYQTMLSDLLALFAKTVSPTALAEKWLNEDIKQTLDIILSLWADMIRLRLQGPHGLHHPDLGVPLDLLKQAWDLYDLSVLWSFWNEVIEARTVLNLTHPNQQLLLEHLFIQYQLVQL